MVKQFLVFYQILVIELKNVLLLIFFLCITACNSLKMSENVKIFITGASGLLGRQIFEEATAQKFTVIGTAYSR